MLARTNGSGRFTLKQLREPYLVRVCSESVSGGGGGHRARRSGECDQESSKRFTPSYLGPDGNLNSWMRHTRFFRPQLPHRSLGRVVVQPPAVVTGTWKDGANRLLYLTRIDGSIAAQTITDDKGLYRFEVAPGPYRIEADRDEGLRTDSTVPGYLSKRLLLRAGRTTHVTFRTRHAGIIRGLVSTNGVALPDQFLAILDKDGDFAAGVVTNEIGRYVVSSLKPGPYTVTTSYAGSAYVPKSQIVAVDKKTVATADLALDPGRSVSFSAADVVFPGANGSIDAELRNADGRVVKVFQGNPATLPGGVVIFSGLPMSTYSLYVRRSAVPSDGPEQTEFPWASQAGRPGRQRHDHHPARRSDQPTMNLTGTPAQGRPGQAHRRPRGHLAAPVARRRRPGHPDGAQLDRAVRGRRLHRPRHRPGRLRGGGDHRPQGARRQADHHRRQPRDHPLDGDRQRPGADRGVHRAQGRQGARGHALRPRQPSGDRAVRLPGLRPGRPVLAVPDRLGQAEVRQAVPRRDAARRQGRGRLLDLEELYAEHPDVLIPDNLVSSARNEVGTPYWFTARKTGISLTEGGTVDLGVIKLKIHGVNGVRAVIGGGGRQG